MKRLTGLGLVALLLVALLVAMGGTADAQERAPAVTKQKTLLLYPATQLSAGATTYTASPRTLSPGVDASAVTGWANVDIFPTVDLESAGYVTLTLQFSADGTNWADADYEYATGNTTGTVATQTYVRYLTADGTELIRTSTAGEYLRVKIQNSVITTPTIYVTYRN